MPRVLISYSRDSDEHAERMLALSDRLRADGVDCRIDQYVTDGPPQGWPLWMDEEIDAADAILVVFTKRYTEKTKDKKCSGVKFESVLILQDLYEAGMLNKKFIPVVLDPSDAQHLVKWLRAYECYDVSDESGYERLRRRLLDDPELIMPPVGVVVRKGPRRQEAQRPRMHLAPIATTAQEPLHAWPLARPYSSAPFDIGAVWGMQTGAFIGIIEGVPAAAVASRLHAAQELLQQVLSRDDTLQIPRREWLILDTFSGRIDPANVVDDLNKFVPGLPRGVIVDIVDARPATLESLQDLARALLRGETDAMVVPVDRELASSLGGVAEIERVLRGSGASIEIMRATPEPDAAITNAAAGSDADREQKRRSLWIAANVDEWLDRWLMAYVISDGSELAALCAIPDSQGTATVRDIGLGLLRLARSAPARRTEVLAALERIETLFDRDMQTVVNAWRKEQPAADASDDLLLRAGMSRSADPTDSFAAHPLFVQSDLPTRDRLLDLLRQDARVRAMLGLCTPEEWMALRADSVAAEEAVDLRLQRPLPQGRLDDR
jgi:TIR domain